MNISYSFLLKPNYPSSANYTDFIVLHTLYTTVPSASILFLQINFNIWDCNVDVDMLIVKKQKRLFIRKQRVKTIIYLFW